MRALLYFVPVLGCAGMMVLCMALMSRGMRRQHADDATTAPTPTPGVAAELEALRAEVAELRAERAQATDETGAERRG